MALTFPLAISSFWDDSRVLIRGGSLALSDVRRHHMTAGGAILDSSRGFRMWAGSAELTMLSHESAIGVDTILAMLTEGGASFLLYDKRKSKLAADPNGLQSGITMTAVGANKVDITLSGFSAGFQLYAGDSLSFTYGSNPLRYAYHRVVQAPNAADGFGVATSVQVTPPIRDGYTLPASVTVNKARLKAKIVPGSLVMSHGRPGRLSDGAKFDFVQTLGV